MSFKKLTLMSLIVLSLMATMPISLHAQQSRGNEAFSQAELDQMLAPVALYPDALLSQILMAATYPLEVIEAARWSTDNPNVEGDDAVNAVADMDWDPSVKALVAFPQVLARMDEELDWTRRLGEAWLMQEEEVVDSIQRLRESAHASGYLDGMEHCRAYRENDRIIIEPLNPRVVYVPYYQPVVVYSNWWWPDYPPYYWDVPPGFYSSGIFSWGHGIHIEPVFFFSTFHWTHRHIVILDRPYYRPHFSLAARHHRFDGAHRWRHDSRHRRGVGFRAHDDRRKFHRYGASPDAFGKPRQRKEWRDNRFSDDNHARERRKNRQQEFAIDRDDLNRHWTGRHRRISETGTTYRRDDSIDRRQRTSAEFRDRPPVDADRTRPEQGRIIQSPRPGNRIKLPSPASRPDLNRPGRPEPIYWPSKSDRGRVMTASRERREPQSARKASRQSSSLRNFDRPTRTDRRISAKTGRQRQLRRDITSGSDHLTSQQMSARRSNGGINREQATRPSARLNADRNHRRSRQ